MDIRIVCFYKLFMHLNAPKTITGNGIEIHHIRLNLIDMFFKNFDHDLLTNEFFDFSDLAR